MSFPILTMVDGLLSAIELAILRRITNGLSNQEIADSLEIDVELVQSHVRSILEKVMQAAKRSERN